MLRMTGGSPAPAARGARSVPGGATVIRVGATPKPDASRRFVAALVQITARACCKAAVSAARRSRRRVASSPLSSPSGWCTSATSRSLAASAAASPASTP